VGLKPSRHDEHDCQMADDDCDQNGERHSRFLDRAERNEKCSVLLKSILLQLGVTFNQQIFAFTSRNFKQINFSLVCVVFKVNEHLEIRSRMTLSIMPLCT